MPDVPRISASTVPLIFAGLGPIFGRWFTVELRADGRRPIKGRAEAGLAASVAWGSRRFDFAAEARMRGTPRVLADAIREARRRAEQSGRLPMVVVPYLGEARIARLEDEAVSGLDLCGNGLVVVPGRIVLRRTGAPNRYPESRPARFAYRGATSLVPRIFLRRTEYSSVSQVRAEVEAAGGDVAPSTVSKALARMVEDLVVDRSDGRIALVQPDALLDALLGDFAAPRAERTIGLRVTMPLAEFFRRARGLDAPPARDARIVLSGASSLERYGGGLRADPPVAYVTDLELLRRRMGDAWHPVDRFAGLTVIETRDPTPFLDARPDEAGVPFASPVQAYLELAASGDKRDVEMAGQVRARLLRELAG